MTSTPVAAQFDSTVVDVLLPLLEEETQRIKILESLSSLYQNQSVFYLVFSFQKIWILNSGIKNSLS